MKHDAFEQLWQAFCAQGGVQHGALEPDGNGTCAFHARVRGYTANVTYSPALPLTEVYIMLDIGPAPHANEAAYWRQALKLNTTVFGPMRPVFGLGKDNRLLAMLRVPLEHLSGDTLHDLLLKLADMADAWLDECAADAPGRGTAVDVAQLA